MPKFLPVRTSPTAAIGVCGRCRKKMYLNELKSDPNIPGLRVCRECSDVYDPYRLGAKQPDHIALDFARPDESLVFAESTVAATLRVMTLDFMASQSLDPRLTFSRADTVPCATYYDVNGVLQTAALGAPRFDYHPTTHEYLGLLIEGQRTNLLLHSNDLSQGAWYKNPVTIQITPDIDGYTKLTSLSSDGYVGQIVNCTGGATYVGSVTIRSDVPTTLNIFLVDNGGVNTPFTCNVTTEPQTFSVVRTTEVGATTVSFQIGGGNSFTTGEVVYVRYNQLEAAMFASSYIPTGATTVTRPLDNCKMTGDNFSYWFEHDEGTFVAEYDINYTPAVGIASVVMDAGRSTSGNYDISISASRSSDAKAIAAVIDNTTQYSAVPNYSFRNQVNKISIGYKVDDCRLAINGILGAVDGPPSTLPSGLTTLHIGTTDANVLPLYGHIRKITYYNQRVTDEELLTLTS